MLKSRRGKRDRSRSRCKNSSQSCLEGLPTKPTAKIPATTANITHKLAEKEKKGADALKNGIAELVEHYNHQYDLLQDEACEAWGFAGKLEHDLEEKQNELKETRGKLRGKKYEISRLNKTVESLKKQQEENKKAEEALKKRVEDLEEKNKVSEGEKAELSCMMNDKATKITSLQVSNQELDDAVTVLLDKYSDVVTEKHKLEDKVDDLNFQLNDACMKLEAIAEDSKKRAGAVAGTSSSSSRSIGDINDDDKTVQLEHPPPMVILPEVDADKKSAPDSDNTSKKVSWTTRFEQLVAFKKLHGHCNVPQCYKENKQLGKWVRNIRQRRDRLSKKQIKLLDDIGFDWGTRLGSDWETQFEALVEFKQQHGHCNVPVSAKNLYMWIQNTRRPSRKPSEERIARLDALGFIWNKRLADWTTRYYEFVEYKQHHGHCNVPGSGKTQALYQWVRNQRQKKNELSEDQMSKLNAIGFVW